jgi:hypothetical protein
MALCAAGVLLALLRWSAADVRSESGEVIFYFVFSLAGIVAVHYVFAFFGISLRDDAIERRNRAALCAVSGLTTGASCCIAGANAGNGPGGEVVFFCATLSIGTLFVFWVLLATIADMAEAITVERDLGAGVRAGAFLASCGAIFAAVVAGDWTATRQPSGVGACNGVQRRPSGDGSSRPRVGASWNARASCEPKESLLARWFREHKHRF